MPLSIKIPKLPKLPKIEVPNPAEEQKVRWKAWREHPGDSYALFLCWDWLVHQKRMKERVDFLYRPRYGGDFYFPGRRLSWLLRGESLRPTPSVMFGLASLRSRGVTVVQLKSTDIEQRTVYTLTKALAGEQVAH